MTSSDQELINTLSEAAKGLLFPSEMDYPFEVFIWDGTENVQLNEETVLRLTGKPLDSKIEPYDFDTLFYVPTLQQDWHQEREIENLKRFQNLVAVLKKNLKDIKVFRSGSIEMGVYIIGRALSGNIAGISTKQLQT